MISGPKPQPVSSIAVIANNPKIRRVGALSGPESEVLFAALAAKIIHNNVTLSSLETQLSEVKSKVGALEKVDLEFENLKRFVTIFNAIDKREPLKLPIIEELTRILPQDTWLTDMSMKKNKIDCYGY